MHTPDTGNFHGGQVKFEMQLVLAGTFFTKIILFFLSLSLSLVCIVSFLMLPAGFLPARLLAHIALLRISTRVFLLCFWNCGKHHNSIKVQDGNMVDILCE